MSSAEEVHLYKGHIMGIPIHLVSPLTSVGQESTWPLNAHSVDFRPHFTAPFKALLYHRLSWKYSVISVSCL